MSDLPDRIDPEDDSLLDIALAIADGKAIDTEITATDATRIVLESDMAGRLLAIDRIVRGYETLRAEAAGAAGPAATVLLDLPDDVAQVRWGPLIVREKVGAGSFGLVYRAWDPRLDRDVALKILDDDRLRADAVIEEARALARVHHPNVVTVHGAERVDGRVGIWMEFVAGQSLAEEVATNGPLPHADAAAVVADVCRALAAVHGAGLLHRDVKAQNVMRAANGRIVLGDFGTTIERGETADAASSAAGTPLYLAPEVLAGAPATVRSDVYSAGVLLHFLLSGMFPVTGRTVAGLRDAHRSGPRVRLRAAAAHVPASLAAIADRAIDPDPSRRLESAEQLGSQLEAWRATTTQPWWRRHAIAVAAVAVAATVIGAMTLAPLSRANRMDDAVARYIADVPCANEIGAPTADGRWIACLLEGAGSGSLRSIRLVLFSPLTGETRPVWEGPPGPRRPVVSPDGRSVAAAFPAPGGGPPREVRILDVATGAWRPAWQFPPDVLSILMSTWNAADGRLEVYVMHQNRSATFVLVSPADGVGETAVEFTDLPTSWARSPNGRWFAFATGEHELRVCDLVSGDARSRECATVASHPAMDFYPFFGADGSLFFNSDRGGTIGVWRVELAGLAERSVPVQVRDLGRSRLNPVGLGPDGELLYWLTTGLPDVLVADLTAESVPLVRSVTSPTRINRSPAWSPDGRYLAYLSSLGPPAAGGTVRLVIVPQDGSPQREFEVPDARFNPARVTWSTDSRTLGVRVVVPGSPPTITFVLFDREAGATGRVLHREAPTEKDLLDQLGDTAWLDADTVAFSHARGVGVFDVATGTESAVWVAPAGEAVQNLTASPDRAWLALTVVEADGTPFVRLHPVRASTPLPLQVAAGATGLVQSWTADGRAVLVTRPKPLQAGATIFEVWRVPVDGSPPSPMPVAAPGLYEVRAHPDGRRLAISTHAQRAEFFMGLGR